MNASPTGKRFAGPIMYSNLPRLAKRTVKKRKSRRWLISLQWIIALSLIT
jgi:hypothetical protein